MALDKFGNEVTVIGCKDKKGTGFPKGYFEWKGQLFKVEPSTAKKDGVEVWIRVTAMKKQAPSQFGNNSKGGGSFGSGR
jgi:hypothetical protein